ncbi:hypothetical protein E2542_SST28641 [Spatholobus suberectus]|nr:hypothetical protein E2542_SST28641 [Spatholobus suberectus]
MPQSDFTKIFAHPSSNHIRSLCRHTSIFHSNFGIPTTVLGDFPVKSPSLSPSLAREAERRQDPPSILIRFGVLLGIFCAEQDPLGFAWSNGYGSPGATQRERVTFVGIKKRRLLREVGANRRGHIWVGVL